MLAKGKHSKKSSVVNVIIFLESDSCLQKVSTLKNLLLLMLLFCWLPGQPGAGDYAGAG